MKEWRGYEVGGHRYMGDNFRTIRFFKDKGQALHFADTLHDDVTVMMVLIRSERPLPCTHEPCSVWDMRFSGGKIDIINLERIRPE